MVALKDIHWAQPRHEDVRIEGRIAYMSQAAFEALLEYEPAWTLPSRRAVGMMWKCFWDKTWILRYVTDSGSLVSLRWAEIVIVEPNIRETVEDHLL